MAELNCPGVATSTTTWPPAADPHTAATAAFTWQPSSATCTGDSSNSRTRWCQAYTPDCAFDVPFTSVDSATKAMHASLAHLRTADGCLPPSRLQYDIVAAGQRQRVFNYQVALPHFGDEAFLAEAVERCVPLDSTPNL